MTPDEAYAVLGVCDPIKHGRTWAENIWGVDGLPLSVALLRTPNPGTSRICNVRPVWFFLCPKMKEVWKPVWRGMFWHLRG